MRKPLFAIAASSFGQTSETFIRDHALTIAPGRTLLLSQDRALDELNAFATLEGIDLGAWRRSSSILPRYYGSLHRYWRRYVSPVLPVRDSDRATAFLQQHRPAALMVEYGPTGVMLEEQARCATTPLYVHFHGFDAAVVPRLPYWKRRYRRLFESAAGVIGPSQFIADMLERSGCPAGKIHVCACGIDPERFASFSGGSERRLIAVGRMVPKKAPHLTIEAFGRIAHRFPGSRLDIIGSGQLMRKCRSLIRQWKLEDRVVLHGAQSHEFVAEMMSKASIFVQHSVTSPIGDVEGMPVSVLEAMSAALPVVATRHSGIQEAVIEGDTGLLVPEHDVEAMSKAMTMLLEDPVRAAEMGAKGRARVLARYTQEVTAATLRSIMGV